MVFGLFEGQCTNIFHFSGPIPGSEIYKLSKFQSRITVTVGEEYWFSPSAQTKKWL